MLPCLPSASSLWSSRWSLDNPVTCHPSVLYDGKVEQLVSPRSLGYVFEQLQKHLGAFRHEPPRLGAASWDVECTTSDRSLLLRIPLAVDAPGSTGRSRCGVARTSVQQHGLWRERGCDRFVLPAEELVVVAGKLPVAVFPLPTTHHMVTFARCGLQVHSSDAGQSWRVPLGPESTTARLTQMVAALAYHYEPQAGGGVALTDVAINDGDLWVRRTRDGGYDVRLGVMRHFQEGISPSLLLSYLVTLVAYEVWEVDEERHGIPVPVSNPSLAFAGLVQGRRLRAEDEGRDAGRGESEALEWIASFGRHREGRAYRPWVECFLRGDLLPKFGDDLRERWWRLLPLRQRLETLALRGAAGTDVVRSRRELSRFLARLSAEIGSPAASGERSYNDASVAELLDELARAGVAGNSRDAIVDRMLETWPHRSWSHLEACVPDAAPLRSEASRTFGRVIPAEYDGTLDAFGSAASGHRGAHGVANAEIYGAVEIPAALQRRAVEVFPSFERYMDAALHDSAWGYYAREVTIGVRGHFETHPESLTPHFGAWVAEWALRAWREAVSAQGADPREPFVVVEFGAGNGRLARDFLDAVRRNAEASGEVSVENGTGDEWRAFSAVLEYRIYERSAALRERQRELLRSDAIVCEGDARHPGEALQRDFPGGLEGVVVSNELLDAFGAHKVLLTYEGDAFVALVVPRLEPESHALLGADLAARVRASNDEIRREFGFSHHATDWYLDGATFLDVMRALARLAPEARQRALDAVWFEEAYVSAREIAPLSSHLSMNGPQYACAVAAEETGVVQYVNVAACDFMSGLAACLRRGLVLTVDYGDTTWGLVQGARKGDFRLRVYGDRREPFRPRPNDPYTAPGLQDLTVDVNFTDVAHAAAEAGLQVVHYGLEAGLAAGHLQRMIDAPEPHPWGAFLGNPVFKLLIVGTWRSSALSAPGVVARELTRAEAEESVSGERVAAIRQRLDPRDGSIP